MTTAETVNAFLPLLSIPLFTAAVVALVPIAIPTIRWNRRLKNELAVLKDLPDGEQKDRFERRIVAQAKRLNDYHELIPIHEKVLTWVSVPVFVGLTTITALQWDAFGEFSILDNLLTALVILIGFAATLGAFTGRTSGLMNGEAYRAYMRNEIKGMKRQTARRTARRRLRGMKKAEKRANANRPTVERVTGSGS
ncbi:hypothetical protein [Rathayibacter sp. VKM Ac-2754]|uniref:hypothetical protein n=1 Tax=Rathayibacter sp. VKM Ac-2754 TaxID=2609251 RepID=UPI001356B282|nr:hypothetical protein [Rathayibacter sp. VKM Ac-2754]MWV58221.1 hypothetical protein [Rathayibacter sp. VKM Ac-2754]